MPNAITAVWPRNISQYGSDKMLSALGLMGMVGTSGALSFSTTGGDFWIYLNGTNPATPMWGGLTEVMTNPAGGVALGTAVTPIGAELDLEDGITIFGTERYSGAAVIVGPKPALGLMNGNGANITYLFALPIGDLRLGTEAQWLAGAGGTLLATKAPSGFADPRRVGATLLGNTDSSIRASAYNGVVVQSSGLKGAGLILASGDHKMAVTMSIASPTALKFEAYVNWKTVGQ
jgi:hypothetical protein